MAASLFPRCLRLSLRADEPLPAEHCWRIERGCAWLTRWGADAGTLTLGIGGPDEVVSSALIDLSQLGLGKPTGGVVEEDETPSAMERRFLEDQLHQAAGLPWLNRVLPAKSRLLHVLGRLAYQFGTVASQCAPHCLGFRIPGWGVGARVIQGARPPPV